MKLISTKSSRSGKSSHTAKKASALTIANTVDDEGNITGAADVSNKLASSDWTNVGDYYYYNGVVQPNETTENLLAEGIDLNGIQVTILASAIQAEPDSAVAQAWGVQFDGSKWSAASGT